MPFVLDAECGRVDITAAGQRHEIRFAVDRIRQVPAISVERHPADVRIEAKQSNSACSPAEPHNARLLQRAGPDVKTGTDIKVYWPKSACSLLESAKRRFLQLATDYTYLNPHLSLAIDWFGEKHETAATNAAWSKWFPSNPTSAHWYRQDEFERLVSAYLAHDQDRGEDRFVRDLVAEFRGLTGTAKQKAVLDSTGLARTVLSALANDDGLRHDLVANLLAAMQKHSKPVKPAVLGVIGREHLEKRFADLTCEMESFQYRRSLTQDDAGLPVVIETAFAWKGERCGESRRIVTGVNWSPGIVNPFRTLGNSYRDGLTALLEKRFAGADEPIVFLLHCVCPRVRYTDRGKSAVVIG